VVAVALVACLAHVAPDTIHWDFESGTLEGWAVVEGRFDLLVCDRATFRNTGEVYNKSGKYYLSTIERANYTGDDSMTGIVESPVLTLDGPDISFLVGGGARDDTYVALCTEDGTEALRARGVDDETMQRVEWDASAWVGRRVFIRIVDHNTGGWGHVTFDDCTVTGHVDEAATGGRRAAAARERVLGPLREMLPALRASVEHMTRTYGERCPRGAEFLRRLSEIEDRAKVLASGDDGLLADAEALQREALVANPLVSGRPLVYVVRPQYLPDHHNTETMFQTGEINTASFRGGGALKTLDFVSGEERTLVDVPEGIARDPDVSFDGTRVVFAMRRNPQDDYHIYEVSGDGTGLRQLTFGAGLTDIDPVYLPSGQIAFTSTREPKYCMCNRHIMGNLFRMDPDGANPTQIGKSTLFEGHGDVLPDGRVVYDRWEYVDRNFGDAQGLWACNPDGTEHALYWGNNTRSPGAVLDPHILPASYRAICTFGSCHDRPWGALAIVDHRLGFDGKPPVVRTWPASAIDLVMVGDFDTFTRVSPKYEDPYPLDEDYYLCSRMTGEGERMGIYLLDSFGNEILLHVEGPGCFDPMPLAPRATPPVIPDKVRLGEQDGTFYVSNVYIGTGMDRVPVGSVKYLRVVESPEKRFWSAQAWNGQGQEAPAMGWHDFNNKRILGTVPVEPDGSAYFRVPADRFVYFQLLDGNGMMVQSMRSGTIARPGEVQGCIGCHEDRGQSVPQAPALAVTREPGELTGWHGPAREFSYRTEVQPVLDRYCLSCHDYGGSGAGKLVLAGDRTLSFCASYTDLWRKGYTGAIGAGPAETQQPYSWGSHASRLIETIRNGHYGVGLDPESFDRLVTWVDINAPYYPSYATNYPDNLYGRSPLTEAQLQRLRELSGAAFTFGQRDAEEEPLLSFDRPELSPILARFSSPESSEYRECIAIIRAGAEQLARSPRPDSPGFTLAGIELARERKYQDQARLEEEVRAAIARGDRVYPHK